MMKRIAFIENGVVTLVLNCEPKLYAALMAGSQLVDATDANLFLTSNWTYDGAQFIEPVKDGI